MAVTRRTRFILHISADDYLSYYNGSARNVVTQALDGRTIKFPANILRPFVSHDGVHGEFVIEFDDSNKFVAIHRIA